MTINSNDLKERFLSSIKRGTGEAYLILKNHSFIDFSSLIIKGATINFAYDQQCKGSRATYIFELIKIAPQKEKIIHTLLAKLRTKKKDFYGLSQMCDLAVMFSKKGYTQAKEALLKRFEKNIIEGYDFCGEDQLIEVYGLAGLLKVAEFIGKRIVEQEDWEDSWRVDNFQKTNKEIAVYSELEKAGGVINLLRPTINRFLKINGIFLSVQGLKKSPMI